MPITSVATAAAIHVANTTPSTGIPACDNICGFTTMMYAMVMNVVSPPNISLPTLVPCSCSLKSRSSNRCPCFRNEPPL